MTAAETHDKCVRPRHPWGEEGAQHIIAAVSDCPGPWRAGLGRGMRGFIDTQQQTKRGPQRRHALAIKKEDNVATAIRDIASGEAAVVGIDDATLTIPVSQAIALGHKLAVRAIGKGDDILKYGTVIGRATQDIQPGEHVHVHNVESTRGRGDLA
jgi:altronate dehydratase small subunit